MDEIRETPFSLSDKREMVNLTSGGENLRTMTKVIKQARAAIRENPDLAWDNFLLTHSADLNKLEGAGSGLLQKAFEQYQENHQAVRYWQNRYTSDPTKTSSEIQRQLELPENFSFQNIQFLENCCAVRLSHEDRQRFLKHLIEKVDGGGVPTGFTAEGFYQAGLFLEDDHGRKCMVICTNDSQSTQDHEQEHTVFEIYYQRQKLQKEKPKEQIRQRVRQEMSEQLKETNAKDVKVVADLVKAQLRKTLFDNRVRFYNEFIAFGTGVLPQNSATFYENIASWFKYSHLDSVGAFHPYGVALRQTVDGLVDGVMATNLPEEDKLKIWWEIEKEGCFFQKQIETIGSWIQRLWIKTGEDKEEFVSILYALPIERVWQIGYFIDQDPLKLRQQIQAIEPVKEEVEAYSWWAMQIRNLNEIYQQKISTEKDGMKKKLTDALQQRSSDPIERLKTLIGLYRRDGLRDLSLFLLDGFLADYQRLAGEVFTGQKGLKARLEKIGVHLPGGNYFIRRAIDSMFVNLDFTYSALSREAMIAYLVKINRLDLVDKTISGMKALYEGDINLKNGVGRIMVQKKNEFWEEHGASM